MDASKVLVFLVLFIAATTIPGFHASEPDALQDLCVAETSKGIKVNGFPCKEDTNITASDFFFAGLAKPAAINNSVGSAVTLANVDKIPGLNTLGISFARIDYSPDGGLNPPHIHPRATEIVFVLDGELDVGFITTANKLISKTIKKGEIFVFPKGLLHFQQNKKDKPASVIAAFNSQLPGTLSVAAALFSSSPPVDDGVLARTFQIGADEVGEIKSKIAPKKK
ncbi:germin-like protein subfamily 2 member 4 [Benincasa hispida]|uniref:germin-like protein subfamily 2 member 4 n=1 Tax=Benincasa hispida TaxID=102211 RepID=UPI001900641A|nr:germin-like protein subfamily 2 member 4 [Benincasa hispida]XP_038877904.1 germin-like protein subfamily 2 member 4 [Benincasa hispida]